MPSDTLTIIDNRTGRQYSMPISEGTIRADDLRQIKTSDEDFGLMSYDPSFLNTATCHSDITYVDGEAGVLWYRGYPIEQLAEKSSFLETAYLIIRGELPTQPQLDEWTYNITMHTLLHERIKKFMEGFRYDAHPMGILVGAVGALSTFYPDAKDIQDPDSRDIQTHRAIAKMPSVAAMAYRQSLGLPYIYPDNDLSYVGNFLNMLFHPLADRHFEPDPVLERAVEVLFILHADHEQNCSANAMRSVASSHPDPYSALAAAVAALYGPLHGGANEAVVRMLEEIGSVSNVPAAIDRFKNKGGRLMGFGHRVYKNYDPRARIVRDLAYDVFEVTGANPLLDIAVELEQAALSDDYFIERQLYPNVDFYSGIIYQAMGFPTEIFPVLFAIPRTVGWMAQWREAITDKEQKIARPRQVYSGMDRRDYVPMSGRDLP